MKPETKTKRSREWEEDGWSRCNVPERYRYAHLLDFPGTGQDTVEAMNQGRWLFAEGQLGTGKTHYLVAVCRCAFIAGRRTRFDYVPDLLGRIKASIGRGSGTETDEIIRYYREVPVLALDDISAARATEYAVEILDQIVNWRYGSAIRDSGVRKVMQEAGELKPKHPRARLLTAVSANLSLEDLGEMFPRSASRIREAARRIPLLEVRPERS